jgi:serine/threonine protein kinase/tetratricopeptide (TPR) repeat protein
MPSSQSIDLSREPLAASLLSVEQKERLTELLDRYLSSLEEGIPVHPETLVEQHPDLAEPLRAYLASLDELHCAAAGFGGGESDDSTIEVEATADTRRLGDFILGRELGRGGMGIVYEARQISLDRTVALKVLPFAAVLDSKQIARFKSEAQAAAQILHPNIVPVFAIGVDRGVHFYAMQFIDGQALDLAIAGLRKNKRRKTRVPEPNALAPGSDPRSGLMGSPRLTPAAHVPEPEPACDSLLSDSNDNAPEYFRTVARLGIQAAEALHAAHEYGVVHRDIKPSNLLLDHEGKLWVTDFGLARCQRDATFSKTGDIIGTMRYMSPEQACGQTSLIDQRADVYSLGVTLYELLTLEPAVQGADGPALLRSIDQHNPQSLRKLRPKIPADLENVVLKAMAKLREDRYTTAQGFADDLRRFLDGKPTIAKPATATERITKWGLRHKRVVMAVASVSLLACVGFAVSTILIAREKLNSDRNFARAEQNFRDAQDAVDRFGAQFAERLAAVPGAGSVRRGMLQDTLNYYKRFAEQAADDPSLQADLAMTYSKIGTLADDIGSTEEAIAAHEKSLALFTKLAAAEPSHLDYQRRLALCQNNLAMSLRRAGRVDDAQHAYQAAIESQNKLVGKTRDEQYVSDLAISHTNLGLLLSDTGFQKQAESSFREAIRLQEQLVAYSPDDAERHRKLAVSFNNLSAIYLSSSAEQTLKCYEAALEHQQLAIASQPDSTDYAIELAATYNNLGALQSQQQEYTAASQSYEQAIQIQQRLLKADPSRKSYRQDLAVSFNNFGLVASRLSQTDAAEKAFEQSVAIQESIVALHPDDMALRSSLGGVYNNLGIAFEEQRRFEDAALAYKNAVEQQRVAYLRAPTVTRYRVFLSKHYFNFGRVLRQLGQPDRAAQVAIARRELWPTDGERLFSVAEELALASRDLQQTPGKGELTADHASTLAIEALEQAVEVGFQLPQDLDANETFSALKDSERFLQLVSR